MERTNVRTLAGGRNCRKRQHRGDYKDTDYPFRVIPEVF